MINDQHVDRACGRFQFESELFLHGRVDRRRRPLVIIRYLAANVEFARKIQKAGTGRWRFSRPTAIAMT
jgi:hypothetical protein